MVGFGDREGPRWLPAPSTSVLAHSSGLIFRVGHSARVATQMSEVRIAVMTALRLLNYAFYSLYDNLALEYSLIMYVVIFPFLLLALSADIGSLHTVRSIPLYSATSSVDLSCLRT